MTQGIIYNIQRMSVHDGPGLRTTIFLKGCPLRCLWCSNPESQSPSPQVLFFDSVCIRCGKCVEVCPHGAVTQSVTGLFRDVNVCQNCGDCVAVCAQKARVMSGVSMTVAEVMEVVHKDSLFYSNSGGGVTLGGGEPTFSGKFFFDLAKAVCASGYHLAVDTCGFCQEESFAQVLEVADLLLYDCKHMDPVEHKRLTGQDNTIILKNLEKALQAHIHTQIRMPLIPDVNDSEENIKSMAEFLLPYGKKDIEIMPYHSFGENKYRAILKKYPDIRKYEIEELKVKKSIFMYYGLNPIII